jgi:hypothetical protein
MRRCIICTLHEIKEDETDGICSMHVDSEKCIDYTMPVRRPEWKRPLVRPRHKWGDRFEVNIKDIEVRHGTRLNWPRIGSNGGFF